MLLGWPCRCAATAPGPTVVVPELWARALAGLLYATAPLATGALAQGRIGELALLVLAPPALAQVVLAFRAEQPREPWRPALRFALLAAVAIAMSPAAVVSLGLVVAVAIVAALVMAGADGRRLAVRQSLYLAVGFGLALLLLLPWSGRLLTGAVFADLARPLTAPGLADLPAAAGGAGCTARWSGAWVQLWLWPPVFAPPPAAAAGLLAWPGSVPPWRHLAGQGAGPRSTTGRQG